jgi:hypothetical protein
MTSKSFHALILGAALLFGGSGVASLQAQDGKRLGSGQRYPSGLDVAFEWRYSCPGGRGCSFSCPGSGGASSVTRLVMYLGAVPVGSTEHATGVFYEFSTLQIPRSNGFVLTTGLGRLSCQVQGMNLDYSGPTDTPPAAAPTDMPTSSIPDQSTERDHANR